MQAQQSGKDSSGRAEEGRRLARLREEQERAIQQTREKSQILEKYKQDYIALKDRLLTLPDKVSYDVMVPFGKQAFMPGKLVHTNEVMVLLGDNWFAEMSAKQATGTVDRRVAVLDKQLEDLRQQGSLLQPRLEFTSELQDMAQARGELVEIKEEYDEEKEKLWREQHSKNVVAYNKQRKQEEQRARQEVDRKQEVRTDSELWDRLAQLEKHEEEAGEMDSTSSESGSDSSSEEDTRKIRWKDENPRPRDHNRTIYFTHSKMEVSEAKKSSSESAQSSEQRRLDSESGPGDIYTHFKPQQPKSILKHNTAGSILKHNTAGSILKDSNSGSSESSKQTSEKTDISERQTRVVESTGPEAFSGSVIEKVVTEPTNQAKSVTVDTPYVTDSDKRTNKQPSDTSQQTSANKPEQSAPQRPVSRFKAQRMAKK